MITDITVPHAISPETNFKSELSDQGIVLEGEDLKNISHIKRFIEYYEADPEFRKGVEIAPAQTLAAYHLEIPFTELRWMWDQEFYQSQKAKGVPFPAALEDFIHYEKVCDQWVDRWRTQMPDSDPRFQKWRDRQMARVDGEISKRMNRHIAHIPVAFELTKGCSVGCWFCGVSAPKFSDIFIYTPENAQLWRQTLQVIKDICGPAAGSGICYWATDPLDNPDYERFMQDFHAIFGRVSQMTTAQPMKNPERVRSFLQFSDRNGFALHRFSILSLKILKSVFAEFTPEELIRVNLVMQNKESLVNKAVAGRSREQQQKSGEFDPNKAAQETIACVSGFLFNMVERSVKLISPCKADDRWPKGYRIYDQGTFETADHLKVLLERMIVKQMPLGIRSGDRLRFRRDLKYEKMEGGFKVATRYLTLKFRNRPLIQKLGEVIANGDKTMAEIVAEFEGLGVPAPETYESLNLMFNRGILDEEPSQSPS